MASSSAQNSENRRDTTAAVGSEIGNVFAGAVISGLGELAAAVGSDPGKSAVPE